MLSNKKVFLAILLFVCLIFIRNLAFWSKEQTYIFADTVYMSQLRNRMYAWYIHNRTNAGRKRYVPVNSRFYGMSTISCIFPCGKSFVLGELLPRTNDNSRRYRADRRMDKKSPRSMFDKMRTSWYTKTSYFIRRIAMIVKSDNVTAVMKCDLCSKPLATISLLRNPATAQRLQNVMVTCYPSCDKSQSRHEPPERRPAGYRQV